MSIYEKTYAHMLNVNVHAREILEWDKGQELYE